MTTQIKGIGATVTYDHAQLSIKHRGMGTVTVPIDMVLGCELDEPRFMNNGTFRIITNAAQTSGMMPSRPLTVNFGRRDLDSFRELHAAVIAAMSAASRPVGAGPADLAGALQQLADLHASGALSTAEYGQAKARLLAS